MLYNESPVYYYSVATPTLNYGNFCWGAVLGAVVSPAPEISCSSVCLCLATEVSLWRLLAEQIALDHLHPVQVTEILKFKILLEESLEEYWPH